jgi:lysozyme
VHALQSPEAETAGRALRTILAAVLVIALFVFLCVGGVRTASRFVQSPQFDTLICQGVAYTLAKPLGICDSGAGSSEGALLGPDGKPLTNPAPPVPPASALAVLPPEPTPSCVDPAGNTAVVNVGELDMTKVFGVDVSHYQDDVPWKTLRDRGVLFGYVKATEGTKGVDEKFYSNWPMMKECGILRGAYHFYRHDEDPLKQAQHFVNTVQALGVGELPLVIDLEKGYDKRRKRDCKTVLPNAVLFAQTVAQSTGHPVMVYSSAPLWNQYFSCSSEPDAITAQATLAGLPLWTAHYEATDPPLYGRWTAWSMWQYSDRGILGEGQLDLDRFPGDYTLLTNWRAALTTNPSATPAQVAAAAAAAAAPAVPGASSPLPLPLPGVPAAPPASSTPGVPAATGTSTGVPSVPGVPAVPTTPTPPLPGVPASAGTSGVPPQTGAPGIPVPQAPPVPSP